MTQLTPLKQKIKAIQTTQKITHAIRLASRSVYSKLEKQNKPLKHYQTSIDNLFSQIANLNAEWKNPILFPDDILNSNPLFIIISSAKGLCGSFNSNLFRYLQRKFFLEEHQKPTFIAIGTKAIRFIQKEKLGEIICSHNELTSNNFDSISKDLTDIINNGKTLYSSVSFYSNHFKNFFIQQPQKTTLIPISTNNGENDDENKQTEKSVEFIYEQDEKEILDNIANKYLKSSILNVLFQSLISENAARFLAMDSSTTNAENFLEKLTLQYNKSRQALITREVSELAANM